MKNVLSSNQISGFFDCQYLWKETNTVIWFLYNSYQRKIVFKSTTVDWLWTGVSRHVQTCLKLLWIDSGWSGGCTAALTDERLILELQKGGKCPHCDFDFINKIVK